MMTPQRSRRYTNPTKSFRRKPPRNSHVVKSLFGGNLPLNTISNAQTRTINPNQDNNQKQWSSKIFKPLYMTNIPGYPKQMLPRYEKWLPKFTGNDVVSFKDHMSNFWAFFQFHPISDDVEYLAMKLFFATLYDGARR
jgi:hypothetical protein